MSGEQTKLVFQNTEERELWREACLAAVHANAQMASLIVSNKVKELDPHEEGDSAVLAYRERCGESAAQPPRDEGPWAVWSSGASCWWGIAGAVRVFYDRESAASGCVPGDVVAPFPRTRAEFERGPGAVDGSSPVTVTDGMGSTWAKCGPDCTLGVTRPGEADCYGDTPATCPKREVKP